jgi:hypothetical protein
LRYNFSSSLHIEIIEMIDILGWALFFEILIVFLAMEITFDNFIPIKFRTETNEIESTFLFQFKKCDFIKCAIYQWFCISKSEVDIDFDAVTMKEMCSKSFPSGWRSTKLTNGRFACGRRASGQSNDPAFDRHAFQYKLVYGHGNLSPQWNQIWRGWKRRTNSEKVWLTKCLGILSCIPSPIICMNDKMMLPRFEAKFRMSCWKCSMRCSRI